MVFALIAGGFRITIRDGCLRRACLCCSCCNAEKILYYSCRHEEKWRTILLFTERSGIFRLHACVQSCVFVCVSPCFTCVHAPGGETACVGCYLLLQRVTANHQPWQTLGERGGKREGEMTNESGRERRLRRVEGLAFEFRWFTTEGFGSCCLHLCVSLDLSLTTVRSPTSPTDN